MRALQFSGFIYVLPRMKERNPGMYQRLKQAADPKESTESSWYFPPEKVIEQGMMVTELLEVGEPVAATPYQTWNPEKQRGWRDVAQDFLRACWAKESWF